MGERLAEDVPRERGLRRTWLIPVPDSARTAALAMAQERWGLPYREGLVKNRYVGRTFIMADAGASGNARCGAS